MPGSAPPKSPEGLPSSAGGGGHLAGGEPPGPHRSISHGPSGCPPRRRRSLGGRRGARGRGTAGHRAARTQPRSAPGAGRREPQPTAARHPARAVAATRSGSSDLVADAPLYARQPRQQRQQPGSRPAATRHIGPPLNTLSTERERSGQDRAVPGSGTTHPLGAGREDPARGRTQRSPSRRSRAGSRRRVARRIGNVSTASTRARRPPVITPTRRSSRDSTADARSRAPAAARRAAGVITAGAGRTRSQLKRRNGRGQRSEHADANRPTRPLTTKTAATASPAGQPGPSQEAVKLLTKRQPPQRRSAGRHTVTAPPGTRRFYQIPVTNASRRALRLPHRIIIEL